MRTLTQKGLFEIVDNLRETLEQTKHVKDLEHYCHFSIMIGNLVISLNVIGKGILPFEEYKKSVIRILREINDYFIALGTNEKFRKYEFSPGIKIFESTQNNFVGYTKLMLQKIERLEQLKIL